MKVLSLKNKFKRPLLFIFLFLVVGIILGEFVSSIFICISIVLLLFLFCRNYLIIFTIIGFVITLNAQDINYTMPLNTPITINGTIKNVKTKDARVSFLLKTDNNINIMVYSKLKDSLANGNKISVKGNMHKPHLPRNKSDFNEVMFYKSHDITYKMYGDSYNILSSNLLCKIRKRLNTVYNTILPHKEAGILKSILTGDKDSLDDDTINLYRKAGIYHILAISGLHIGILAFILTKLFNLLHRVYGKIIVIFLLIAYCIFTGSSISTLRATIMCITILVSYIIYRDSDFISCIAFSAILLLFKNPYYLFDVGFLYSYIAVLSIALLGGRISSLYNFSPLLTAFTVSLFVSIAIKPITAYYFYTFTLFDIILNIIIMPFVPVIIILGLICSLIGFFSIPFANLFVGSIYYILRFFELICNFVTNTPFSSIVIGRPEPIFIIGIYILLIMLVYVFYDKYTVVKKKFLINFALIICIISTTISLLPKPYTITMLDVEQGDSIVGIGNDGNFLVDGGYHKGNIIIPYLHSNGITKLDFVFISHMDMDHLGGIIDIMDNIKIDYLFLPKMSITSTSYNELLELASTYDVKVAFLETFDKLELGNISFELLHPDNTYENNDINNNSLVFRLKYLNNSMLFTGDIEKSAEAHILDSKLNLKSDILKVAHHGSKSSSTKDFIDKVDPDIALISLKENNIYNHPHKEVLKTLEDKDIKIYRTDLNTDIEIKFYKNKYTINY